MKPMEHPLLAVIMKHAEPKSEAGMDPEHFADGGESEGEGTGESAAGEALVEAIKTGDGKAVWEAFHTMFQMAENQPHEENEEGEGESFGEEGE